jgi:hypothetical protein
VLIALLLASLAPPPEPACLEIELTRHDDKLIFTSQTRRMLDAKGRVLVESREDQNGLIVERRVFEYDDRGMALYERFLGDKLDSRARYERKNGIIITTIEGQPRKQISIDLDAKSTVIEGDEDGDGVIDVKQSATYDTKGRVQKLESWRNDPTAPCQYTSNCAPRSCTTTFTYDANDRETLSLSECSDGNSAVTHEYDAKGRVTLWTSSGGPRGDHDRGYHHVFKTVWSGNTATQLGEQDEKLSVTTFDERGRALRRDEFDWAGVRRRTEYRYTCTHGGGQAPAPRTKRPKP